MFSENNLESMKIIQNNHERTEISISNNKPAAVSALAQAAQSKSNLVSNRTPQLGYPTGLHGAETPKNEMSFPN